MRAAVLAAEIVLAVVACLAQAKPLLSTIREASVRRFLQEGENAEVGKTTRYFAAFVDLKDDGKQEVIVYVTDATGGWCGSGGCTTLVLVPDSPSYKIVSRIVTTRPPIRVLATKSNGWHDLSVRVQGGGILRPYEAKLSFNGKSYPFSPSSPRAQRVVGKVSGEVVVPSAEEGTPLY
jgi:hypothetical protein